MKNVILYCRVSSDEQKDNTSLDYQETVLRAYCNNHGYHIVDCKHEDYSAKHYDLRRPEMKEIYHYCKKHKRQVDLLLFLRWDRFARNAEFAFTYIRKFGELGVSINSVETPIDFNSPDWSTLIGVYCGNAQAEDTKISTRTKDGIHATLNKGRCANKAPRGYKNVRVMADDKIVGKTVEIDEAKADVIRQIFDAVAKGVESPSRIRKRLCPYIPESSYFDMLRNPFYIGMIKVPEYKNEPEHLVKGLHKAIIKEQTFYTVQDILDGKRRQIPKLSKKINPDLYLRKFLVCPICGHALTGATSRGSGGQYTYYNCCHDAKHLRARAEAVNDGFVRYVGSLKPNETVLKLYEAILSDLRDEQNAEGRKEAEKLQKELAAFTQRINRANDLYIDGDITKEERNDIIGRNQQEAEKLKERINLLLNPNSSNIKPKMKYSISLINNIDTFFKDAPVEVKIKLLSSMFPEKIEFDGKNYRTKGYNKVLDLIYQQTKQLRNGTKEKLEKSSDFSNSVPRAGVEPARIAPLVFETSASTDSAIWAFLRAKVHIILLTGKFFS